MADSLRDAANHDASKQDAPEHEAAAHEGWRSHATRPQEEGGLQYHIRCRPGDVARYVLLPGDPERVPLIASTWDEAREVARHREYTTYTGRAGGVAISSTSTGIGGPSTAICIEELAEIGADTLIRVGTTGAISPEIRCGDLIIAQAAVRFDGASPEYVDLAYPAAASYEVTAALVEAAERLGQPYHVGVCASTASFHVGQSRPGFGGFSQSAARQRIEDLRAARVLNFEMEAATLFTLSSLFGMRSGAIFATVANRATDEFVYKGVEECIAVAVEAVKILAYWDERKRRAGKRYWFPSLGA